MKTITKKLIKLMQEKGLSQSDLARIAEVSEASVSAWMKGSRPRGRYLLRVSKYYNLDPSTLEDDNKELSFKQVPPPIMKEPSEVNSIFDEEMGCNVKEVLELYSDLLDELAEIEKTESPQLASEEILQRLFFSIVRNSQFLANVLTKLYNAGPHKEQSFADKLGAALSNIQASSYILGACARGTSPERLRKVIQDIQKHSTF